MIKKTYKKIREYIPLFSLIIFCLTIISFIIQIAFKCSVEFADFFNYNLSAPVRTLVTWITVWFPLSFAELFILLSPIVLGFLIYFAVKFGKQSKKASIRYFMVILAILLLVYVLFVWTYSSGYYTSTLDKQMELERQEVGKEELYEASTIIVNRLNELVEHIKYDETGASIMPYSYGKMSKKICEAYSRFVDKNPVLRTFYSRIKPIILSEPMTYTHISGIYSFMSGEANVNVNYPDYIVSSSSAHEMAHQRGIAREDEANFVAFAVLLESDDPFLQYSAYLDVYSYVLSDLYAQDKKLYFDVISKLDESVKGDRISYSKFFEKYANSSASEVTDKINNSYLQANGQEAGTKSYAMVTELACAYLIKIQQ